MHIEISLNGDTLSYPENLTLEKLVNDHNETNLPVAVAVNNAFIPKGQYANTAIKSGDCIDIVSPVGGG